jgi:hypothetical protein
MHCAHSQTNLEEYENIDWRLQKTTGVQSGKLIHKTYVLRTMVTEPLTYMEILIARGRHQSKRTLHSIKQTMAVKLRVGTLNLGCDYCGLYNSREGDVSAIALARNSSCQRRSDPKRSNVLNVI